VINTEVIEFRSNCCDGKINYCPACLDELGSYFCTVCGNEIESSDRHLVSIIKYRKIAEGIYRPVNILIS
jgi:predicted amidophosphoribosyltransferase